MKTVFILIPWFHPAYKAGGPIQSIANLTNQFSGQINFKIFTSDRDLDKSLLDVRTDTWIPYNDSTEVWYASRSNRSFKNFKREIKSTGADVLFIIGIYSWFYNILSIFFYKKTRKIISVSGMLHPGALTQKTFKKRVYLALWKLSGAQNKCDFHASNEEEKQYIQNIFGNKIRIFVAPNFPRQIKFQPANFKKANELQLISVALISPMKNHLLVLEALMKCSHNIVYNIYGPAKDNNYWNICLQQISKLPANIKVNYYGDIPHNEIENALLSGQVFILPSKSENFGHAFYEALTAGKPVITSHKTPWNHLSESFAGINVEPGKDDELLNAINFFAEMEGEEFLKWNHGAVEYANRTINVDEIKAQHKEMFNIQYEN